MKWYKSRNLKTFKRFSKEIFGVDDADEAIKKLKEWFSKIGTPTTS